MIRKLPHLILVFLVIYTVTSWAQTRLRRPAQRSSIWRDKAFTTRNPPKNYDDGSINCGGIHQDETFSNCGVCGDALPKEAEADEEKGEELKGPLSNENGGQYGRGIVVANYTVGQEIWVGVELYPLQLGYFEFHLCDKVPEEEECFFRLLFSDGEERHVVERSTPKYVNTTLLLPKNVKCQRCVLRLQYLAGNSWGKCENGVNKIGCGVQLGFRNCADITIN